MTSGRRFDVCVVGSANLDLVVRTARHPSPGETLLGSAYTEHAGGKGLNQAVAAARAGARTAMVGALGSDAAGATLDDVLVAEGIVHDDVRHVDASTGRALITVTDAGENTIVVVPGANTHVRIGTLPDAAVLLAQLEVPIAEVANAFEVARSHGTITVLNPAPAAELPDDLLAMVDVVVPNEHEAALLGTVEGRVGTVVTTRGSRGAIIADATGSRHVAAFAVEVVDTTAAGDAFCGALACRLAAGDSIDDAVRWAAAAGALATTVEGAVPSIPTREQIVALIASGR